jgi:FecR protein
MKYTKSLVNSLVACGVALAVASALAARAAEEGVAKVVRISGSARYSVGGGPFQPLQVGDVLRPGSVVQTSQENGAYVDLVLTREEAQVAPVHTLGLVSHIGFVAAGLVKYQPTAEQNTVRVFANSLLGIDRLSMSDTGEGLVSDTQLNLKAGRIMGNVKKMSAASRYEIKLPNGVAGIRGTVYDITADGVIRVASGTVVYSFVDAQGNVQTRVITSGQEYNPRTDQLTPLSASAINEIEMSAVAIRGAGAVYINNLERNPSMPITVPITTVLSPTSGSSPSGD